MNKTIFISATNTNVGKTYATKKLIESLSEDGFKVGVFKPIETGVVDEPADAKTLFDYACIYNEDLKKLTLNDICPYQFTLAAAPYVAKKGEYIEIEVIQSALKKIQNISDIVLVEGAGGLMVPVDESLLMVDIAQLFADIVLLVVPSKLGSINDTLLSRHLLESRNIPYVWAINIFEDKEHFNTVTKPYYDDTEGYMTLQNNISKVRDAVLCSQQ